MRKLLLTVVAVPALAGAALAEPLRLDEHELAGVAAGQVVGVPTPGFNVATSSTTNTSNSVEHTISSMMSSSSTNTNHAIGLGSQGVTATGNANSVVTGTMSSGGL